MTILFYDLDRAGQRNRHPILELPGVRIMTEHALELATCQPCNNPHPRPIDGRARRNRVDKAPLSALQCGANISLFHLLAHSQAKVERTSNWWSFVRESC